MVAGFEKGRGYVKQEGSLQYERFETLVRECNEEFSNAPMGKFKNYLEREGIDYLPDKLIKEFKKRVARKQIVINGDDVTFNIKWDDKLRLDGFKTFLRKNPFLISGVLITIASAITAVVLVMRQSLKRTAKKVVK